MPPKKSTLPTKERTLFTTLLQQYETKKHKAGIKTADQILKRFPEHGGEHPLAPQRSFTLPG